MKKKKLKKEKKFTAILRNLRVTPRKARLVADAVRGRNVNEALNLLQFGIKKDVAEDVEKLIKSALANLSYNNADANTDADELRVKEIRVDEGPTVKRFRPRCKGSASPVLKRSCHISVTLAN